MKQVYITNTSHYLPGKSIDNDSIENILGLVHGKPSRLKHRILKANGIQTRHYAIDANHNTTISNTEMAAKAARICLDSAQVRKSDVTLLSCATSQGDLVLPGFSSMVQAELGLPGIEIHTSHGICSSVMMALKYCFNSLRCEDHDVGLVVASELTSRLFKASRYEAVKGLESPDFDAEFLRFMLSDGAGSCLLETLPRSRSLRINWIRSFSHADSYPVCMSVGAKGSQGLASWQDYSSYGEAESEGALLLRQDVRLLDNIVKLGVDGFLRLLDDGELAVNKIDHFLCHYSSEHFKGKIMTMLSTAGALIPEERWYTNLYTRGNTGCASILIMLDEFLKTKDLQAGENILCMVPESGRFNTSYMYLTVMP